MRTIRLFSGGVNPTDPRATLIAFLIGFKKHGHGCLLDADPGDAIHIGWLVVDLVHEPLGGKVRQPDSGSVPVGVRR